MVRILYPTSMQLIILLLMGFLVSTVTTFNYKSYHDRQRLPLSPFDWIKDFFEYEHCGSIWIEPDIDGNNYIVSIDYSVSITQQQ